MEARLKLVEQAKVPSSPEAVVEAFLQHRKVFGGRHGSGCSDMTYKTYEQLLLKGTTSWAKSCGSFGKAELEAYLSREKHRFSVSEIYYVKIVRHLRAFTKWAAEAYGFEDPLAKLRVSTKEVPIKSPNRPQVDAMLKACGDDFHGRRLRLMVALYAGSALRRSEVLNARVGDVDVAKRTIKVTIKGGDAKETPISLVAVKAFRDYMALRPGAYPEDWLIADRDGAKVRPDYATRLVVRLSGKAGLPKAFAPHSLRHFAARRFLAETGDLVATKELLNHSTMHTTLRYAKMDRVKLNEKHRRYDPLG